MNNHYFLPNNNDALFNIFWGNNNNLRRAWSEGNFHSNNYLLNWWMHPPVLHEQRYFEAFSRQLGVNCPQLDYIPLPPTVYSSTTLISGQNNPNLEFNQPFAIGSSHSNQPPIAKWKSNWTPQNNFCKDNPEESKSGQGTDPIRQMVHSRYWCNISTKPQDKQSFTKGFNFTLMSFNVLAQNLLNDHPYLYRQNDHRSLDWNVRFKNILFQINSLKPDVLCLQEVQESHLDEYFNKNLESMGFKGVYKKRTGIRCDGCAIYYKTNRISLIEYETVEFLQPNVDVLNRDNVAIIAKLCPKDGPKYNFIVATTHLLYNPKRQDVRLAQMQLLLAEIERLSFYLNSKKKEKYYPIIITGDFNSTPFSALYEFITKGTLKYDHLAIRKMHKPEIPNQGSVIIPSSLQITDECQHASLVQMRKNIQNFDQISRTEEVALIRLHNSDKSVIKKVTEELVNNPRLFSSGTLKHLFAFKSVYHHGKPSNPEGTTFQDEWITVDYIFYSGKKHKSQVDDHKLKLLSVYRIPRRSELQGLTIPNALVGSDHLCLAAKFMLKMKS